MAHTNETLRFLEYRDTGSPEALAQVFDAVAPKLLLLAAHLSHDHAMAEDLVQTTFVTAMERAAEFRSDERLLPWLNGILLNGWRQERRKITVRERHRTRNEGAPPRNAVPTPDQELFSEELLAAVGQSIDQLPKSYQQVLNLRLLRGMKAIEIAHILGLSPGTVRSQLKRGLEMLQRHLPKSLVIPSVLALLGERLAAGRGLAEVRAVVMQSAIDGVGVVSLTTGTGLVWIMKKWTVAAILVLLALGAWTLGTDAWFFDASVASETSRRPEPRQANTSVDDGADGVETEARVLADAPEEPRPNAAPMLMITGRCVDSDTGLPVPGFLARVEREFASGEWELREAWQRPESVPCDSEGRFSIVFPRGRSAETGIYRLVFAGTPHRVPETGFDMLRFEDAVRIDLGDVLLFRSVSLAGRVADEAGRALPGMKLHFLRIGRNPLSSQQALETTTDSSGRFRVHLERGSWGVSTAVRQTKSGSQLVANRLTPDAIDLAGSVEVDLIANDVSLDHRIGGRVVDTSGRPIAKAEVFFRRANEKRPAARASTDESGRFCAYVPSSSAEKECPGVLARVYPQTPRRQEGSYRAVNPDAVLRWGTNDARIVLELVAPQRVAILVQVAGEQTPVEEYGISVGQGQFPRPRPEYHKGGRGEIFRVSGRNNWFRVYPTDPELLPSAILPVSDPTTTSPLVVHVARKGVLSVRVVDTGGKVVVGTHLRLMRTESEASSAQKTVVEVDRRILTRRLIPESRIASGRGYAAKNSVSISEGLTDALGQARLSVPSTTLDLDLVVLGPGHIPKVVRGLSLHDGTETIVVDRGATLRGTVRPLRLVDELRGARRMRRLVRLVHPKRGLPGIQLRRKGEELVQRFPISNPSQRGPLPIERDGSFVLRGVPPGTWGLYVWFHDESLSRYWEPNGQLHLAIEMLGGDGAAPLVTVTDLRAGEDRRIDLDISKHMPSRIEGRALVNGAPVRYQAIYFFRVEGKKLGGRDNPWTITDADGHFVMAHLPPGRYALWRELRGVARGKAWRLRHAPFEERVDAPAGARIQQEFHSKLGSLSVRFRGPDGKPFGNSEVEFVLSRQDLFRETRRTSTKGLVQFPSFVCGDIEFRAVKDQVRFDPPRIRLHGTGTRESFEVIVHPARSAK